MGVCDLEEMAVMVFSSHMLIRLLLVGVLTDLAHIKNEYSNFGLHDLPIQHNAENYGLNLDQY